MGRGLVLLTTIALPLLVFQPRLHGQTLPATRAGLLSEDEVAAMAGDLGGANDAFGQKIAAARRRGPVDRDGRRATHVNVPYGDHPRQVFDLWLADSDGARPLVVFIHGGGFKRGDKLLLADSSTLPQLLDAGISVAGVNYRFSHQCPDRILGSLTDIARCIQHLRHHASDYNLNKDRVAAYGGSAGGAASLWLACRDDLADPNSDDPVSRQSSRLTCAGAMATPSTLDLRQWKSSLGLTDALLLRAARSFGVLELAELESPEGVRLRAATDYLAFMSADDAPIFVHNSESGTPPTDVGHMAHHPNHARVLKERAGEVGLEAVVHAPRIGISHPSGEDLVAFLKRHLLAPETAKP